MKCEHLESESLFVSFPKRASTTTSSYRFSFQQPTWLIKIESENCLHRSMEAGWNLSFVEMKAAQHSVSRGRVELWDWKDSGGMTIKHLSLRSVCSLLGFLWRERPLLGVEWCPSQYVHVLTPGFCECDLIWKECLCWCNWLRNLEVRPYWVIQVGPRSNDKHPYKWPQRRKPHEEGSRDSEWYVTSQGSRQPQKADEARTGLFLQNLRRKCGPANALVSVLWPPDCERTHFCWPKPPGLWSFVTTALGNRHTLPQSALHSHLLSTFPTSDQPR